MKYVKSARGESYGKVHRQQHPNWKGWQIIDDLKNKPNFPKNLKEEEQLLDDLEYSLFSKE